MSQEVEIIEGARGRNFSRVNRIKTDKQDGGACFWVPENERRLTSLPAFQNGEYEPGKGYYAFDSVDASVMHFDDFDINIDDYDLPHIDLDGIDITIDETGIPHINFDYEIVTVDDETIKVIYPGGKEVIIHGPDLDGPVNIDDVFTIDFDKETGTWTITAITDVTSGDNEFAPGDIVAQWPVTEHVDIHIGQSISIPDLGDIDLDFDADIDVSVDLDDMDVDISGIDMNGLDVDVSIDLDTLIIDTFDFPDEIRIMHVPNKTSYKDGEEIDLDGLVVQAYRGGEVWEDKEGKYYNGYVPVHELSISPKKADKTNGGLPITGNSSYEIKGKYGEERDLNFSIKCSISRPAVCFAVNFIYGTTIFWAVDGAESVSTNYVNTYETRNHAGEIEERTSQMTYSKSMKAVFNKNGKTIGIGSFLNDADAMPGFASVSFTRINTYPRGVGRERRSQYDGLTTSGWNRDQSLFGFSPIKCESLGYTNSGRSPHITNVGDIAYSLMFGGAVDIDSGIIVSWNRPRDGKNLEAKFEIFVESKAGE